MKRLKLQRDYHDSRLVHAEWLRDRDLRLTFSLDGAWNDGASVEAAVMYSGVRNRDEVDDALRSISEDSENRTWLADIVAMAKDSNRVYSIDTSQGRLIIDATSFSEI